MGTSSSITDSRKYRNVLKHKKDAKLCPGNHDFSDIIFHKISQGADLNFYDKNKEIRAKIEDGKLNSYDEMSTIRTIACSFLISKNETRCSSCVDVRKVLKVTAIRISNYDPNIVSRNMPNKYMTTDQRNLKLEAVQRERKSLLKNRSRVETKIENMISREGIAIEEEKIQDIQEKVLEKEPVGFDENSPYF